MENQLPSYHFLLPRQNLIIALLHYLDVLVKLALKEISTVIDN